MHRFGSRAPDLTGQQFHRLTVISRAPNFPGGNRTARWHCICACGQETISSATELRNGRAKSCGCYSRAILKDSGHKHGGHRDKLYKVWTAIKQRCLNPDDSAYHNYGARGIAIADEWRNDYAAFAEYMGERPSDQHTVERIDNNRGYEPGNVCWATRSEQLRNKRTNLMITHNGKTMCLAQWADETGINYATLRYRIFVAHYPLDRAMSK